MFLRQSKRAVSLSISSWTTITALLRIRFWKITRLLKQTGWELAQIQATSPDVRTEREDVTHTQICARIWGLYCILTDLVFQISCCFIALKRLFFSFLFSPLGSIAQHNTAGPNKGGMSHPAALRQERLALKTHARYTRTNTRSSACARTPTAIWRSKCCKVVIARIKMTLIR